MRVFAAFLFAALTQVVALPAFAAAGTTCLCRSPDGKSFVENTVRHHRWACDFHFGYLRGDRPRLKAKRPVTETCNLEEIVQWKIFRCMSDGCTYAYARSTEDANPDLKKIETAPAQRRP